MIEGAKVPYKKFLKNERWRSKNPLEKKLKTP